MKKSLSILLFWAIAMAIVGCAKVHPSEAQLAMYSEDSAMEHYLVEPERSLAIIDSAVVIGNLSRERADYLRAIIYYDSTNEFDKGIELCKKLIDKEAWETISDYDGSYFKVEVYRLICTIYTTTGNNLAVLRYAREGAALAHGVDILRGDEADFMSRMGFVMCKCGQVDEGLDIMQRAEELAKSDNSWSSLITYLNNSKKLFHVLSDHGRYEEAEQVVKRVLQTLEGLRGSIESIKYAPQGLIEDTSALEEFIQYYQVTLFSYLTDVYTEKGQLDTARIYLQKVRELPEASDPALTKSLVHPLIVLGEYDAAEQLLAAIKDEVIGDEMNEDYLQMLKEKMDLAIIRGEDSQANLLSREIFALSDSLKSSQFQILLAEEAAQYQLQDERQRRVDAENRVLHATVIVILLCVLIAVFFVAKYIKRIHSRYKKLKAKYAKAKKDLEAITGEVEEIDEPSSQEEIYHRAETLMKEKKLFKDPSFDINVLASLVPTNRSYLSAAINTIAGMNFRTWLAKYRVEYAKQVLLETPEITTDKLAEKCGFDNRTSLYRQFKSIEGMTTSEWLQSRNSN